jgi:hypothetical protein
MMPPLPLLPQKSGVGGSGEKKKNPPTGAFVSNVLLFFFFACSLHLFNLNFHLFLPNQKPNVTDVAEFRCRLHVPGTKKIVLFILKACNDSVQYRTTRSVLSFRFLFPFEWRLYPFIRL